MNTKQDNSGPFQVDTSNFSLEVLKSNLPVLTAFATQWSRPCQVLASVLDEMASSCSGILKIAWVNVDENPDLGQWYNIQAVPTLLYFIAGNVRCRIVGTATKSAILTKLERITCIDENIGE